jgi:glycosyltransferase involved in cell wall biosynthesis
MPPLVSVVIPTCNRLAFLKEAVASVRAQTFSDWELIVADDGSTDGTRDWLATEGIALVLLNHTGLPGLVRNRGVDMARGMLIAFLDSDDLWDPKKLALQTAAFRDQPGLALCHTRERWLRDGRLVSQAGQRHAKSGMIFTDALVKCIVGPSTLMLDRARFLECSGFAEDLEIAEDYELLLHLTARHAVAYLDQPLVTKRGGHPDQLSGKYGHIEVFRIRALETALARGSFRPAERALLSAELKRKCLIHARGAAKRGKIEESRLYEEKASRADSI